MAIFSKMLEVFLSILLFCLMACGTIEHSCQWSMDVLEMSSKPEKKFYVSDNVIYPGRSYFLRIRPSCENQIYPFLLRSLVFTGYTPHIKLEVLKYGLESVTKTRLILYTEGVLVQFNQSSSVSVLQGNFLLLDDSEFIANPTYKNCPVGQRSSEKIPQAIEENLSSPQCSDSRLCNVAWFVPLSVEELPVVIKCSVTNPLMMEEKSLIVHSIGPRKPSGNRIGEHISSLPDGYVIDKTFNINRLALPTPFWVISALRPSDYCLLTDSEFETTSLIKVHNISQAGRPKVCPEPCSDDEIKGTLSLPDRILLATCFGLQEIQTTLENYHSEVILPYCIIKLVTPPQSFPGNIKILAIEESSARVFESKLDQGTSLNFSELKDTRNLTLCEFLASELDQVPSDCLIQDGSINSIPMDRYIFLVFLELLSGNSFYTVLYTDKKWKILFKFPSFFEEAHQDDDVHGEHWTLVNSTRPGTIPIYLNGLSFTRNNGDTLFIWGSVLLYSENGGREVLWLWDFPQDSNITVFDSTDDGSYALLTESGKVWWGNIGTARLHLLEAVMQWNIGLLINREMPRCCDNNNILSLFFDDFGKLWRVIHCQSNSHNKLYLSKTKIPVSDLLSHAQLIHEQTANDDVKAQSTVMNQFMNEVHRHCVQFSVTLRAPHSNYYFRHIVNVIDMPHLVNTVPVSPDVLQEYLEKIRTSMSATRTAEVTWVECELPSYIYLKKEDFYVFEITLKLDSSVPTVSSSYFSSLDQLTMSYRVSDFNSLNVSVVRNVFSHEGTVRYQISIQDSGWLKNKNPPGIGLHPVEFRVQPWQADEACFIKKTEKGILRGTQSMKIFLGCPPGLKIIFDPQASTNASKRSQFCEPSHGIACFLFENSFHPVFNLLDESTGNMTLFTGKYRLTIVGGGRNLASVKNYSQRDIVLYNYKNQGSASTLIWTPKTKDLGSVPAFNISTNGLQWLCGRRSPCAEITPVFPHSPEFYFKLEFSNRDIEDDTSNCDLTGEFIIRIHGIPLGSLYPATVIVATCLAIITSYVFTMYALKRKDHRLSNLICNFLKLNRDRLEDWVRTRLGMNKSTVGPLNEASSVEDYDTQQKKKA